MGTVHKIYPQRVQLRDDMSPDERVDAVVAVSALWRHENRLELAALTRECADEGLLNTAAGVDEYERRISAVHAKSLRCADLERYCTTVYSESRQIEFYSR